MLFNRATTIADNLPLYVDRMQKTIAPLTHRISTVEETAGKLGTEAPGRAVPEVKVKQSPNWPTYLIRGFGSLYGTLIVIGIVPFLMFFMLLQKEKWYNTAAHLLGPKHDAADFANRLAGIVRKFVFGNMIVGFLLASLTMLMLFVLDVRGAFIVGLASGVANLVPFLGVVAAALLAMVAAWLQYASPGTIVVIGLGVVALHIVSANLIIPRFIGSRINIGPVAATAGILFWGWLWGLFGVLLALPLTGIVKLLVDYHPGLTPLSNILGTVVPRTERTEKVDNSLTSSDGSKWQRSLNEHTSRSRIA